ncbi:MAG: RHS repeat protein, partial [Acidimicrobiales bacterium]|nr:RHS repeat protein [Acidimicrobiales bacterium]
MATLWSGVAIVGGVAAPAARASNGNAPAADPVPTVPQTTGGGIPGNNHQTTVVVGPVNTATGEHFETDTDLAIPGHGLALDLTRTYSTNLLPTGDPPFGVGWIYSYGMALVINQATGNVTVDQGNGSAVLYVPSGGGAYTGPTNDRATLTQHPDGTFTYARTTGEDYDFDSNGRLLSEVDRNGNTTTLTYSGRQLTSVTDPGGRSFTFTYDSSGHIATVTDPVKRQLTYTYDTAGDLTSVEDAADRVWTYGYDSTHHLTSETDPRGGVTTFVYDGLGRTTSVTDPLGRTTTYAYNGTMGGVETTDVTDPRGNTTAYAYQSLELMTKTEALGTADQATTTYTYDPTTLGITSITDPLGHVTTYAYDPAGNTLSATDGLGNTATSTYNGFDEP